MMAGRGGEGHSVRTITTVLGFHAAEGLFILGMHEEAIDVVISRTEGSHCLGREAGTRAARKGRFLITREWPCPGEPRRRKISF
jgi:hypothetical protein